MGLYIDVRQRFLLLSHLDRGRLGGLQGSASLKVDIRWTWLTGKQYSPLICVIAAAELYCLLALLHLHLPIILWQSLQYFSQSVLIRMYPAVTAFPCQNNSYSFLVFCACASVLNLVTLAWWDYLNKCARMYCRYTAHLCQHGDLW